MQRVQRYLWELPEDQRTLEIKALIERLIAEADLEYDVAFEAGYEAGYLKATSEVK